MKVYQDKIQKYTTEIIRSGNSLRMLSTLRLVVFLSSVIVLVVLANERLIASVLLMSPLCVLAFGVLVKRYNNVDDLKRHTTFLKQINEREILRLENRLSGFPTGQTYVNGGHPYASDLDIFGQHSLFQLLDRTTTDLGQRLLAEWISSPADSDIIYQRQEATRELSQRLEWRQEFQARGMHFKHSKDDYEHLLSIV